MERNPDFLLISYSRNPLKTQGKLKNGFQNTLPFSRPPRYDHFGNSPHMQIEKQDAEIGVLSLAEKEGFEPSRRY